MREPGEREPSPEAQLWLGPRGRVVSTVLIDGEALVYDPVAQRTHLLNPTATLVWELLDERVDLEQLAEELAETFGIDVGLARAQLVVLARDLHERQLLEASPGPGLAPAPE